MRSCSCFQLRAGELCWSLSSARTPTPKRLLRRRRRTAARAEPAATHHPAALQDHQASTRNLRPDRTDAASPRCHFLPAGPPPLPVHLPKGRGEVELRIGYSGHAADLLPLGRLFDLAALAERTGACVVLSEPSFAEVRMRPKMPGVWCQRRGAALIAAVYAGECALVWDIAGSVSADGLAAVIHECVCVLCPRRLSPAQHRSAAAASATASGGGSASGAHLRRRQSLGGATPAPAEKNLLRSALASAGAAALPRLVVTCSLPWNQRGDCAVRRSRLSNRLFRCRQRASGAARVCAAFLVLYLRLTCSRRSSPSAETAFGVGG